MLNSSSFPHSLLPVRRCELHPPCLHHGNFSTVENIRDAVQRSLKASSLYKHNINVYQFYFEEVDIPIRRIACRMRENALSCTLRIATAVLKVKPIKLSAGLFNKVHTFHGLDLTVNAWVYEGLRKILIVKPVPRDIFSWTGSCLSSYRPVQDKQYVIHLIEHALRRSHYASCYY